MNIRTLTLTFVAAFSYLGTQLVHADTATVDFESQTVGTQFGGPPFGNSPGDLVFTEDDVDVRIDQFTLGTFMGFNNLLITNDTLSNVAFVNNVLVEFDPSSLPAPVTGASFSFVDSGGDENLVVNGSRVEVSEFALLPATLGGVDLTVNLLPTGALRGTVTLDGPISSLGIGGQELSIDNVQFNYNAIPEPSTGLVLVGAATLATVRRRR